jgi:hypothetical protein
MRIGISPLRGLGFCKTRATASGIASNISLTVFAAASKNFAAAAAIPLCSQRIRPWHPTCIVAAVFPKRLETTMEQKNQGEGNREADRRYRRGVRETVEETTPEERARRARDLTPEEQDEARAAEETAKAKSRAGSSEREI